MFLLGASSIKEGASLIKLGFLELSKTIVKLTRANEKEGCVSGLKPRTRPH